MDVLAFLEQHLVESAVDPDFQHHRIEGAHGAVAVADDRHILMRNLLHADRNRGIAGLLWARGSKNRMPMTTAAAAITPRATLPESLDGSKILPTAFKIKILFLRLHRAQRG